MAAFDRIERHLYMEPVSVSDEFVGEGDGIRRVFALAHNTIREGSVVMRDNGADLPAEAFSVDLATGDVTFAVAPAEGHQLRADYIAGRPSLFLRIDAPTLVLGLRVAHVSPNPVDVAIRVRLNDVYLCFNKSIPAGRVVEVPVAKTPLRIGDEIHITASDDGLADAVLSVLVGV